MRATIALAAAGLVAACVHHAPACPRRSPTGTWTLRSINGATMPFTMSQSGNYKAEMISVTLDVGTDGRFTISSHTRESMNGRVNDETSPDVGTYALSGDTLMLHFQSDGKTTTALMSCETLAMQERGGTYLFKR